MSFSKFFNKKYGFQLILKKLVDDLKVLESDGIIIEVDGLMHKFFGSISSLVADNLASHEIGGFTTSFSAFRRCRFCNATSDNIQLFFNEKNFQLRTVESYDSQALQVEDNPHLSSVYGIKSNSILNQLQYFHVCWSSPSDIAHDLYEGVCLDLLKVVIEHCLVQKYFSLEFLNNSIKNFSYRGRDKSNKPAPVISISKYCITIKETAAQCHNLVRLLPYFVGKFIPGSDEYWNCFIMFANVLDYILAPALHHGHIRHMEDLISDFLMAYKALNDTIHIKPKGHFLIHYPTQYKLFGPLIHYSTLRFESKHSNLKNVFSNCKNFRNPCLTIATRHQQLQYLHHTEKDFLLEDYHEFCQKYSSVQVSSLDSKLSKQIISVNNSEYINMYKSVRSCGISYEKGDVLLYGYEENYQFGLIEEITFISCEVYFILKECDVVEFDNHMHGYILSVSDNYLLINRKKLYSPYALPAYVTNSELFVRLHHFVCEPTL